MLFFIFVSYSIIWISIDLNRMRCIEGFESYPSPPSRYFLQHIGQNACPSNQFMHYEKNNNDDTSYVLNCYDECSSSYTSVPSNDGSSNCMIPTDSNTNNCSVDISQKCYLDGEFMNANENASISCVNSGYDLCGECVSTNVSECSNVVLGDGVSNCQKEVYFSLPEGYSRCLLTPNINGLSYLDASSNLMVDCEASLCTNTAITDTATDDGTNVVDNTDVGIECISTNVSECSNVELGDGTSNCQQEVSFSIPEGYSSCKLDSSIYSPGFITSDSNFIIDCDSDECPVSDTIIEKTDPSVVVINDGSCSTLDCYGNADYSGDRFDITGKVLGIKIPKGSIKEKYYTDGNLDYKYVILNFNRHTHDGNRYLDMSVGICKDTNKLMKPLSTSNIDSIKQIFEDNVVHNKNKHPKNKRHIEWPVTGNNSTITDMENDPRSAEVITLRGGGYGLYFNFIKEGNKFGNFWNADKVTGSDQDRELWVYDNPIRVRFEFRKNSTTVAFIHRNRDNYNMNGNANVYLTESDTNTDDANITDHYIFLKGGPSENLHVSNLSFS